MSRCFRHDQNQGVQPALVPMQNHHSQLGCPHRLNRLATVRYKQHWFCQGIEGLEYGRQNGLPHGAHNGYFETLGVQLLTEVTFHYGERRDVIFALPPSHDGAREFRVIRNNQHSRLVHVLLLRSRWLACAYALPSSFHSGESLETTNSGASESLVPAAAALVRGSACSPLALEAVFANAALITARRSTSMRRGCPEEYSA